MDVVFGSIGCSQPQRITAFIFCKWLIDRKKSRKLKERENRVAVLFSVTLLTITIAELPILFCSLRHSLCSQFCRHVSYFFHFPFSTRHPPIMNLGFPRPHPSVFTL
ncbi:hypothetical protein VNO78_14007 [Psophocarpus tetragonolobus]|uniref:Uncharacterized protein n=1 Tax=Psophocarpus tetragonolobus TaxID=3891 RepID=A0AAN9SQZ3_PSOTE